MTKKLLLAVLPLLLALPALAQTGPRKVLIVVSSFSDRFQTGFSVSRAIQLKEAGLDVQVIFEGEGVLNFIDINGVADTPSWTKRVKDHADAEEKAKAQADPSKKFRAGLVGSVLKENIRIGLFLKTLLRKMKEQKIQYTLCSASAKKLGVEGELRTAGEPMSPATGNFIDLSPYVKDNYYILFSS